MTGHEPYRNLKFAGIIVGIFHTLLSFHIAVFIVGLFIYERRISGIPLLAMIVAFMYLISSTKFTMAVIHKQWDFSLNVFYLLSCFILFTFLSILSILIILLRGKVDLLINSPLVVILVIELPTVIIITMLTNRSKRIAIYMQAQVSTDSFKDLEGVSVENTNL
ncbi:unnamed protein product [Chironomus riparius]|uniref:Uncharacterized protein n=1 Tax=Chironomus riparius TaxID=315576 RepID=A0A9N9S5S4_9DIPT|nr:unnamed protein product [Chironomus riparius]